MIYGVGTDIIRISRIEAALARHGERFAERILGAEELAVFRQRSARAARTGEARVEPNTTRRGLHYLATRFAAKEAFSKAIGLGMCMPMHWHAVQILNAAAGGPVLVANGALLALMQEKGWSAQVSITDEVEYAVAFVIVEQIPAA